MAKISRTPYNGARYLTRQISETTNLNSKMTGEAIFVDIGDSEVNLNILFLDNGAYFKIILKNKSSSVLKINFNTFSGVIFTDNGVSTSAASYEDGQQIQIPSSAVAGSYLDLICDGKRWYVQGLVALQN